MTPVLVRLREHPDAPRWNHSAGDRLTTADLDHLDGFREALATGRVGRTPGPSPAILAFVAARIPHVPALRRRLAGVAELEREWETIATTSREDIATRVPELVPDDADLARLIVYRTAGTTGHALLVPHEARAVACYQPLIEEAVARHGVGLAFDASAVACFLVGAQARTVTYPTTLSAWGGAGFAKLNVSTGDWPRDGSAARYFRDLSPILLTGDPISFSELLRQGIEARPRAMISTAIAMSSALRGRLARAFGCPVIDWYSLTETGPIGYLCQLGEGYHLLSHDLHVEVIDSDGRRTDGVGEVTVSGGRNPFLPLLRYRTGDHGRLDFSACACGDPTPRLLDLEGRAPVLYRAAGGALVNPVDISRILREYPFVQHAFEQRADRSCALVARPVAGVDLDPGAIIASLRGVLGGLPIEVSFDPQLGDRDRKVVPHRSALLLED